MKDDAWRVLECDLSLLQKIDLVYLGFYGCSDMTERCICNILGRYHEVSAENLSGCTKVSNTAASALGHGCGQLQIIDLTGCSLVTVVGVSALGHGCGQLQQINLGDCNLVTDVGVSALGHGCGKLQQIYLTGCNLVTDVGVSALGHGCGQDRKSVV